MPTEKIGLGEPGNGWGQSSKADSMSIQEGSDRSEVRGWPVAVYSLLVVGQEPGSGGEDRLGAEILDRLRRRLVSFGASRVQRDVAEDLAQETLLLLTTKYAEVTGLNALLPLSLKIMRFKILSHRRKDRKSVV